MASDRIKVSDIKNHAFDPDTNTHVYTLKNGKIVEVKVPTDPFEGLV